MSDGKTHGSMDTIESNARQLSIWKENSWFNDVSFQIHVNIE